ncbi:histidinol-phosphate transaminase [Atopobiaceae bacterium 24-176]
MSEVGLSARARSLVRPEVAGLDPYDPGFVDCAVNLSANESTWPQPAALVGAVREAVAATPLNRYPDPMANALRDELAAWHGVGRDQVVVGNGGDELIFNLLLAFGGPGRRVLDLPPTFSVYGIYGGLVGSEMVCVPRDPETFEPRWDETLEAARTCHVVVLVTPNNPTGNTVSLELVVELCEACPGVVMVDEAYGEFAPASRSAATLLPRYPNLCVLHTLSKAFAMAGARVGYLLASPEIVDVFAAVRQPYTVNVLSQAAALAAVERRDLALARVAEVVAERARLTSGLRSLGLRVWDSEANFVLVRLPDAHNVRERLARDFSILVRDLSGAPGLEGCLRVTVGVPEENDAVLDALATILSGPLAAALPPQPGNEIKPGAKTGA